MCRNHRRLEPRHEQRRPFLGWRGKKPSAASLSLLERERTRCDRLGDKIHTVEAGPEQDSNRARHVWTIAEKQTASHLYLGNIDDGLMASPAGSCVAARDVCG